MIIIDMIIIDMIIIDMIIIDINDKLNFIFYNINY
jgi:hypothetical protein